MKQLLSIIIIAFGLVGCENRGAFLETIESQNNFDSSIKKLETLIKQKDLIHFRTINHTAYAKDVNMTLKPESVVVFGNPKMGTILMNCNPSIGLDLPLRILFNTNYQGNTLITYTNPEYWSLKHNIKDKKCLDIIKKAKIALQNLAQEAGKK